MSMNEKAIQMNTGQSDVSRSMGRRFGAWLAPCAAVAVGLGSALLVGCGGDEENGGQTASTPSQPAPAATPGSSGAGSIDAPAQPPHPADADTRATVDGTLSLFIAAMEEGDFEQALELVDPSTDLHSEILNLIQAVETGANIDDPNAGNIGNFIRLSFALTFAGADHEIVSEDNARARAVITLPGANNEQRSLDLNRLDDEWFIVAGRGLISSGGAPPPVPQRPTR